MYRLRSLFSGRFDMTTRTSKEASRLAQQNHTTNSSSEMLDQELPKKPELSLVEFNAITVDKYSAEQIRGIYQEQVSAKLG
jgi:hypothetical protein